MSDTHDRLGKSYRIMWDQNHAEESYYNPPMTPEQVAQAHLGYFEGAPVDAYVCSMGPDCGYTVSYPTQVEGMEFLVDRLNEGAITGGERYWRHAENLRLLWDAGIDPLQIQVEAARRIGVDFWFRLSMNDWHHADLEGRVVRLIGSRFYEENSELMIGDDGVDPDWEGKLNTICRFQDFAHEAVRALRRDIAAEACERYDVDGFVFDFMRCPGYFKYNEVERNTPLMTDLIRETRAALDEIGRKKGRHVGLCVRVPNVLWGARNLGLDVAAWIEEGLVDIVVPSTFFSASLEEDMTEWVELARGTPVRVNAAIEEAYSAGHHGEIRPSYPNPPMLLPLSVEMIHAIAARHWKNGVDGMYVFNWFGTAATYNYDNRPALDDMGDPLRLTHKNKRYVVTRTDGSFPNCLKHPHQIPAPVTDQPLAVTINVADDLAAAGARVRAVRLHVHLSQLTVADRLEIAFNGQVLPCVNPMQPGAYNPASTAWQNYDVPPPLVRSGDNALTLRMIERNTRLAAEIAIEAMDIELAIEYAYPDGPWISPPGYVPRT